MIRNLQFTKMTKIIPYKTKSCNKVNKKSFKTKRRKFNIAATDNITNNNYKNNALKLCWSLAHCVLIVTLVLIVILADITHP